MWRDIKDCLVEVILPIVISIMMIILLAAIIIVPVGYFSAKHEAQLYNQKFGTHYTVSEFFWAGDTIKEFLNQGKQTTQNIKIEGSIPVIIAE